MPSAHCADGTATSATSEAADGDLVGDDAVVEVDRGGGDQRRREGQPDERHGRRAVAERDRREDQRREQLDQRIAQRDAARRSADSDRAATGRRARARCPTARSARRRPGNASRGTQQRLAAREAMDHDVEKDPTTSPSTNAAPVKTGGGSSASARMRGSVAARDYLKSRRSKIETAHTSTIVDVGGAVERPAATRRRPRPAGRAPPRSRD